MRQAYVQSNNTRLMLNFGRHSLRLPKGPPNRSLPPLWTWLASALP